jgi:hypothetical protein
MRHWKQAQTQASEARKEIHGYTFAVNGGPEAHGPREITHWFGARRELAYEEFLSKLNRKATEGPKADEREQVEQLRKKLDRVAHPEDLAALANDLESERRNSEQSEAPYVFGLLAQQLASMAAGWSAMSPIVAVGEGGNEIDGASGAFSKELASLRDRIERDVTVHVLDAPELSQPPFLDQSLDDAIDKLRKRLAEKGEWRRALQILGMQSSGALPDHLRSKSTDVIHAIRAYLAGENFELAEEWADASSAYETVVRANLDHTPIKEAAKRLELLKTEHPEAVKASGKP